MLDPELKRLLAIVKWETKRKFQSLGAGALTPKNRGRGLEFKEVRQYNYGDDTRYIDWNVTSRTGDIHVKEYYSEQDVPVLINLDCSASMKEQKINTALQLSYFLTLFHIRMGNRVRITLFSDDPYHSGKLLTSENEAYVEFKMINDRVKIRKKNRTNYIKTLEFNSKISPKFSICYWLSDFCQFDGFQNSKPLLTRYENYGLWIEEKYSEMNLPFWFKIFKLKDSEINSFLTHENRMQKDKRHFLESFKSNAIVIRPEIKLSKQILSVFMQGTK